MVGDKPTDYSEKDKKLLETIADHIAPILNARLHRDIQEKDRKLEAIKNTAAPPQSLHDYLDDQWRLVDADPLVKQAGRAIIDFIDDRGYLSVPLEQLHAKDRDDFVLDHLKEALRLVQQLEPPGVGAQDIRECLLIQIAQRPEEMSFEYRLVADHMAALLNDILTQPVDVRGSIPASIGVGDELAAVLERLLLKSRDERYADAGEVIRELCAATGCSPPHEFGRLQETLPDLDRFRGRGTTCRRTQVTDHSVRISVPCFPVLDQQLLQDRGQLVAYPS